MWVEVETACALGTAGKCMEMWDERPGYWKVATLLAKLAIETGYWHWKDNWLLGTHT